MYFTPENAGKYEIVVMAFYHGETVTAVGPPGTPAGRVRPPIRHPVPARLAGPDAVRPTSDNGCNARGHVSEYAPVGNVVSQGPGSLADG